MAQLQAKMLSFSNGLKRTTIVLNPSLRRTVHGGDVSPSESRRVYEVLCHTETLCRMFHGSNLTALSDMQQIY